MWFKNNRNISKKKNCETNGHIAHNLHDLGANPKPKKKQHVPETIEIHMDFQVWGI